MKLLFHIPTHCLVDTYRRVSTLLRGNDEVIFDAMAEVTRHRLHPFVQPENPTQFEQKHEEIMRQLDYPGALRGRETAMNLMEEMVRRIQAAGGVAGVSADRVLDEIAFETSTPKVGVRLNQDLRWTAEWSVSPPVYGASESTKVLLETHAAAWGEVVPAYVVEYVNTALHAYDQGMHTVAIALLSIAVEATLRDVLEPRGYTFNPGASAVDIYCDAIADVRANNDSYIVTFRESMPRLPGQFLESTAGDPIVEIHVRRVVNWRRGNRLDLSIRAPSCLIDHWSSNRVEQTAQRRVNGLGEAFDIARNQEQLLTPLDLPLDLDQVICTVRNNLVHLSAQALGTPLTGIDPSGRLTLAAFLDDRVKVYDLVTNVPGFINGQYVELRRAGHLAL